MKKIVYLILLCGIWGCGKKGAVVDQPKAPGKASLIFPSENALCESGSVLSSTQTTVTFSWGAATDTEGYEVRIKNLLTNNTTTVNAAGTQIDVQLTRNTPYSWSVLAKNSKSAVIVQTDPWKFYVAGEGKLSYSPFPAALVAPSFGQKLASGTSKISLQWSGADVDNDILSYRIYLGMDTNPKLIKDNLTEMSLADVGLTAAGTYYWKVTTVDRQGNTSESELFQFSLN